MARWRDNLRLVALVLEGYLYILLVLGLFVGSGAFLVWGIAGRRPLIGLVGLLVGVPVLLATVAAFRALRLESSSLDGIELERSEAPALYAMVEELRRRIRAPRIDRIVIGASVNATALQVHRVLLFSPRNVLRLGYPLLVALPPEHLRAVVAHEVGHFSRAHGRFAAWVYGTRLAWVRLVQTLHARGNAPIWVYWINRFYLPRLDMTARAVSRSQEFTADRFAADVVGPRVAADALVAIDLLSRHHDDVFWPALEERLEGDPERIRPYATIAAELSRWAPRDGTWVEEALRQAVDESDTHPTLARRLEALGQPARIPPPPERSAGEVYLGDRLAGLTQRLDEDWARRHGEAWRSRHEEVRGDRERLAALRALDAPTAAERFEHGEVIERLEGADAALPLYRAAAEAGSAAARLEAGRVLLDREEAEGVALVESAMAADEALVPKGCDLLVRFHLEKRRLHEAERCRTRARRYAMRETLAAEERRAVTPLDRLVAHGLAEPELSAVRTGLARHPAVEKAWLARREFRHSRGDELVLAVMVREAGDAEELDRAAGSAVPGGARVVRVERAHPEVRRRLEELPGAAVYP
jgi:Zn-dependent protease with chaperone function